MARERQYEGWWRRDRRFRPGVGVRSASHPIVSYYMVWYGMVPSVAVNKFCLVARSESERAGKCGAGAAYFGGCFWCACFYWRPPYRKFLWAGRQWRGGGERGRRRSREPASERTDLKRVCFYQAAGKFSIVLGERGGGGCAVCCAGWVGEPVEEQLFC